MYCAVKEKLDHQYEIVTNLLPYITPESFYLKNNLGYCPLKTSRYYQDAWCIKILKDYESRLLIEDHKSRFNLEYSIKKVNLEAVEWLISSNAPITPEVIQLVQAGLRRDFPQELYENANLCGCLVLDKDTLTNRYSMICNYIASILHGCDGYSALYWAIYHKNDNNIEAIRTIVGA